MRGCVRGGCEGGVRGCDWSVRGVCEEGVRGVCERGV